MGNITNIFYNENLEEKQQKYLNISTPQFIPEDITIQNNYYDLSNSKAIEISSTNFFFSNYINISSIYLNSLPNSYQKAEPNIIHHYNYNNHDNNNNDNNNNDNNNNDNRNNLLICELLNPQIELIDNSYCY